MIRGFADIAVAFSPAGACVSVARSILLCVRVHLRILAFVPGNRRLTPTAAKAVRDLELAPSGPKYG